ncbi:MAG: hypothetical protein MUF84_18480 [Anaerolineae bacterium]|nr:hypothetical protein [Anaerolineae bacterium]
MNLSEIVAKAWHTTWTYRALWIVGMVLALATSAGAPFALLDRDDDPSRVWQGVTVTTLPGETVGQAFWRALGVASREANRALSELLQDTLGIRARVSFWVVLAGLLVVVLAAIVVGKTARYVSEAALIRMAGTHERTGKRLTLWQGARLGWSRRTWHLFLIDLLVDLVACGAVLALFGGILAPLPLWVDGSEPVIFTFAFITGGLALVAMAAVSVGAVYVLVTKRLAHRACALEGQGVLDAIRWGWRGARQHLTDVGLLWMISAAVHVGWAIAIGPAILLLMGSGLIAGGLPGVAAGRLVGLVDSGSTAVLVGLAIGSLLFLAVVTGPLLLLTGLREVFLSTLWTLAYGALRGVESIEPHSAPVAGAVSLTAAAAS